MAEVRVAVVGLGFGAAVHLPALTSIPNATLIGVLGRDASKTSSVLNRLSLQQDLLAHSIDEILGREPNVIMLAVPPHANEQLALRAIRSGCAVLSEKPLSNTLASAQRLADAARESSLLTGVDFQFAELPVFQRLATAISSGLIGQVNHVDITWAVHSFAQQHRKWSWKTDQKCGGGVLSLLGSHLLYLVEWLFGPVVRLTSSCSSSSTAHFTPTGETPAEDFVNLSLEHASGTIVNAVISNSSPGIHRHLWHICGTDGSLVLENNTPDYMQGFTLNGMEDSNDITSHRLREVSDDGRIAPFRSLAQRFLSEVASGSTVFTPSFHDAVRVQYLIESAKLSSENRRTLSVQNNAARIR
ncbi:Gfo/Idh/MocA family oxidoreductase [Thalassospira sp.]|uniref:Gfo/Idh/MocA family protein n=1 Tax=Thalassospira sp. TaxID=1912094 RepID=UPI000C5EAE95|nr:Gfo/Idh/MocA family oxidoreductase [Thalassospira sp.]MBC07614.1 hypothetical protein [Thalassospira sp.]